MAGNSIHEGGEKVSRERPDEDILVSVIMPAYKCEKTIRRAIDSVFAQRVPLELIVINDASPDNIDEIAKLYSNDSRFVYLKNETNLGVSNSRNKGVKLARGKYIAFLDSDDWWAKEKLHRQLSLLNKEKAVLCCTARRLISSEGEETSRIIHVPEKITYRMLLKGNVISCSSVLIQKRAIEAFPMRHDDSHEDYITWLKILKMYGKAVGIDEPLLYYRLSNKGKSGSKLKSAKMTYMVYRYAGFNKILAAYYFCWYAINGIRKYFF